jgi:predicted DNA-binding transcriptional regulator AlpA
MLLPDFDPTTLAAADIPAALAVLASWQSQLAARLMITTIPPAQPILAVSDEADRMLTTNEAAAMLRRSVKWLYRRNHELPFARRLSGRSWIYSEQGLRKWLARQRA